MVAERSLSSAGLLAAPGGVDSVLVLGEAAVTGASGRFEAIAGSLRGSLPMGRAGRRRLREGNRPGHRHRFRTFDDA